MCLLRWWRSSIAAHASSSFRVGASAAAGVTGCEFCKTVQHIWTGTDVQQAAATAYWRHFVAFCSPVAHNVLYLQVYTAVVFRHALVAAAGEGMAQCAQYALCCCLAYVECGLPLLVASACDIGCSNRWPVRAVADLFMTTRSRQKSADVHHFVKAGV